MSRPSYHRIEDDATDVPSVVGLTDPAAERIALVGGKAVGLARLIAAGEQVPDGFCITTAAHAHAAADPGEIPAPLREQITRAYAQLGGGDVAVRSSASAEDLPQASFAGQHETVLGVRGVDALLDAIGRCWASLSSPRAVSYRAAAGLDGESPWMGVVVQRMVDPQAAGVLFTANPITGTRREMVVDAVAGLGDVVVDGSTAADHYVIGAAQPPAEGGCLCPRQLDQLRGAGERVAQRAGSPQDIEFAFDHSGELWLLQARPITTLFPVPVTTAAGLRVYFEAGHMQGMLRPFTPMGMSAMRVATAQWFTSVGAHTDPSGERLIVDAGGRMYLDLTPFVHSRLFRRRLPDAMQMYGPRVVAVLRTVLDDPRFAPRAELPFRVGSAAKIGLRLAPGMMAGAARAMIAPAAARRAALRAAAEIRDQRSPQTAPQSVHQQLQAAVDRQGRGMLDSLMAMLPPLYGALTAKAAAAGLLSGIASASEVDETLRGMPHNVTTEMDLALWQIAAGAGEHRDLLLHTPPVDLAQRFLDGQLPEIGLTGFLRRYGHRGAAEIDVGVPRWAEDPTPVFAALAGYLRLTDPDQAPDRRFARAADEAVAKIDELVRRTRTTGHPVRATVAGFLLRRSRQLAGLRELPKFAWLHAFTRMRAHLLTAGADLQQQGLLDHAEDIMFLDITEAHRAADGADLRELITTRRRDHEREMHRRNVPGLLLSDGTVPEALAPPTPAPDGVLTGMAAAPGSATGPARVILDPAGAHVEPGEILVAPTTDPGWTPLFLTAAGLITETGAAMAHGPTVAREYGIPAVICVREATQLITTGQLITIDGAAGTVLTEPTNPAAPRQRCKDATG